MPFLMTPMRATANLVTEGSFEAATTGWEGTGGAIARITTDALIGAACLEVTVSSAADIAGARRSAGDAVDALTQYTATIRGKASTGTPTISVYAVEYTALDVFVTTNAAVGVELNEDQWQEISVTFTTQATTGIVRVYAATYGSQTATFKVDGVQLELGATPTPFTATTRAALLRPLGFTGWFGGSRAGKA